ncbi:ArsR/SmtB family transcription factor [Microterricola viridarii]|uniref:ArsR family transcriptional regulator n=1 Tax=Microterricola viridarii TaxID=412690 RepID=A0A109QYX2_9MICO|nr:DUF5937 family protein [Microterricola viridarii]AMB59595.1 ArsR family transcriptional regulator [Microterricola viridarii]
MLRYQLTETDLGNVRFALSPLCELGLSLRALRDPARYPLQLPWLRHTEQARTGIDNEMLMALVDDRLWTPDFLNPRPLSPLTRLDDELDVLRRMPSRRFTEQLMMVHQGRMPAALDGPPRAAIARMVSALEQLWAAGFVDYWPRMRTILEADIVYRGRQLVQSGLSAMLNGLAPTASWDGRVLTVRLRAPLDRDVAGGSGLTLVPTMFTNRASAPIAPDEPPTMFYPARGQGAMWEAERVQNPAALAGIVGEVRAKLLIALGEPSSSTELGIRFGVSTSAVNQHLRVLREAGLLTSTRYGHSMLYLRSELGSALLAGSPAQVR